MPYSMSEQQRLALKLVEVEQQVIRAQLKLGKVKSQLYRNADAQAEILSGAHTR
jgi:hypothetical protein